MMKAIVIRPLTPELSADYLDFFDHRAFTDDNPNGPCYNESMNMMLWYQTDQYLEEGCI